MHLFYDSTLNTWRLITDKLPEKPNFGGKSVLSKDENTLRLKYLETIAALKQNALTVGNPEIIDELIRVNKNWINGNPVSDELYFWPGGYKTKETPENRDGKLVAILTLPEEKKNTMENMTIEQKADEYIKQYLPYVNTTGHWLGFQDGYKQALSESSGSVATPKEEETYPQPGKRCVKEGELMTPCHVIEGSDALDYFGRCFGCGSKRAITFNEENQTEVDAARQYLIKEGLDPDDIVKDGLSVINGIHEKIRLENELAAAKESIKALYQISQQKLYETEVNTVEFDNIKSVLDHAQKVLG